MAFSPVYDRGTRFTNYSSIHSADAFVGDYQVMYTPGSTSPPANRGSRKPSRFTRPPSAAKSQNVSKSFLLPANIPNSSQIITEEGILQNVQARPHVPIDEYQLIASLRGLQTKVDDAEKVVSELKRVRDQAFHELRIAQATSRKPSSPAKRQDLAARVEEELFDLSRIDESSPKVSTAKQSAPKKVAIDQKQTAVSDDARVLPGVPMEPAAMKQSEKRVSSKNVKGSVKNTVRQQRQAAAEDTEGQSVMYEDPTGVSNTSRRRRRASLDDNMTSAYIIPDITEERQQMLQMPQVSREAQQVLHSLEPEHIASCDVCRRLTAKPKSTQKPIQRQDGAEKAERIAVAPKPDYTRKLAGFLDESFIDEPTMRPKVSPAHALARVRALMNAQFLRAKERHNEAWTKYNAIEAPFSSRRHGQIAKEMTHWAEKMEECRVHLDYLRDVEEGMADDL